MATAAALLDLHYRITRASDGSGPEDGIFDIAGMPIAVGDPLFDGGFHPDAKFRALVNEWAFCAETLFHGSPSGLDNTVSTYVRGWTLLLHVCGNAVVAHLTEKRGILLLTAHCNALSVLSACLWHTRTPSYALLLTGSAVRLRT